MRSKVLILICLSLSFFIQAQEDRSIIDYTQKNTYNIGGVEVVGAETRDRNAIKSITGLRIGKEIKIPGDDIPGAIKSLWKLRLFEDVQILQDKIEDGLIYLTIKLVERPTLSRYSIKGEKKNQHTPITEIIDRVMAKGSIVTEDLKELAITKIKEHYSEKGFLDAEVKISEVDDEVKANSVRLIIDVDKKERVKISDIVLLGNRKFTDAKLKRKLKETKEIGAIFKKSKYVVDDFKTDKDNIIAFYNKNGYRDAVISSDSIVRRLDGNLQIFLTIDEGDQYYFRNISWKGNSKYEEDQLRSVLGINAGDVYDPELLANRLSFSQDGRDISSLYLDDGYLFFSADPVEVAVDSNYIDMEMQLYEGPQATISSVNIAGNDRTHEKVVRRELRTKPGNKFSRSEIIRSQRSLSNLGYFNPETMDIQPVPNQSNGTVDINYTLEERPSDQLELSAGYGGAQSGLIGTLGMTFNNFSLKNIKDKSSWSPLPQGDGQKLSLRAQSNGRQFRSYNFTFTEPWLGGKKPTSFTVGAVRSDLNYEDFGQGKLSITRAFVGVGSQLKRPDDFFSTNSTLTLEFLKLDDYSFGDFFVGPTPITNGNFKNFSITQTITRSSVADPIYPRRGSRVSLSVQFTPPYSLFRDNVSGPVDGAVLDAAVDRENLLRGPGNPLTSEGESDLANELALAGRFEFLEYHKWRFNAEWYFNIVDKFVIATNVKLGFLARYNKKLDITPFERFEVGGDGLNNQNNGITGKDILALRGYEVTDLPENQLGGGSIFDKFTVELRYPLSTNPSSAIYVHTFVQGGNTWSDFTEFNPFDLRRSAGFGARVFLPMFGLLGFDYGWGFDRELNPAAGGGFGKFSIVLGFEPE
jgi:outer membrane protein insertion porin family